MPQTLLALLAVIVTVLFAFTQQQSMLMEYEDVVKDEMEVIASGLALEVMEYVVSFPYDAAALEEDYSVSSFNTADLADWPFNGQKGDTCEKAKGNSSNSNAGGNSSGNGKSENSSAGGNGTSSVTTYEEASVLEEFHCTDLEVSFQTPDMPEAFTFDIEVYVHYLDNNKEHTDSATDTKEVKVTVSHERFSNPLAVLSRAISP